MPQKDKTHHISAASRALSRDKTLKSDGKTRAECDMDALWMRFHNPNLHEQGDAMDALEKARVGAFGAHMYKGVSQNLTHSLFSQEDEISKLKDTAFSFLTNSQPINPMIWGCIERHLKGVDVSNQEDYANACRQIIDDLNLNDEQSSQQVEEEEQEEKSKPPEDKAQNEQMDAEESQQEQESQENKDAESESDDEYKIYTKEFDKIARPSEIAGFSELRDLRAKLDVHAAPHRAAASRLSNRLANLLLARAKTHWESDKHEGYLDSSRLARLIAKPVDNPQIFKQEIVEPFKDTVVGLLVDNSGSMRGKPIALAALSVDLMARALERCGIASEILGFTTRAWKGGRAKEKWEDEGQPENAGRLNELLHIIYKDSTTPLRRARQGFSLMLKEGFLKENIDGEALIWAHSRIAKHQNARKILIVISDGEPVDDASFCANNYTFLEKDLKRSIAKIEKIGKVELCAIGIGHDVGKYYKKSITIKDAQNLMQALYSQLEDLLT